MCMYVRRQGIKIIASIHGLDIKKPFTSSQHIMVVPMCRWVNDDDSSCTIAYYYTYRWHRNCSNKSYRCCWNIRPVPGWHTSAMFLLVSAKTLAEIHIFRAHPHPPTLTISIWGVCYTLFRCDFLWWCNLCTVKSRMIHSTSNTYVLNIAVNHSLASAPFVAHHHGNPYDIRRCCTR